MYLDKATRIAGWPAIQLRNALRSFQGSPFALEDMATAMQLPANQAAQLVQELVSLGYVMEAGPQWNEERWQCTDEGFRLADARTTKPHRRALAQQHLDAFLVRVSEINTSDQYLYRVSRVVLFGSMVTDQPLVGDVDLAVLLTPRADDLDVQRRNEEAFIKQAVERDVYFSTFLEQMIYPRSVVWKYLKARSRILSLHDYSEFERLNIPLEQVKVLLADVPVSGVDRPA
ncbi:MAG TPA: hypothetical protein VFS21_28535 [Roseiflexaceae bacterium]|nr:hypothetical protein [Roseiflexaceae bacterium]